MKLELPAGCPKGTEMILKIVLNEDGILEATARDLNGHSVTVHKKLNF